MDIGVFLLILLVVLFFICVGLFEHTNNPRHSSRKGT